MLKKIFCKQHSQKLLVLSVSIALSSIVYAQENHNHNEISDYEKYNKHSENDHEEEEGHFEHAEQGHDKHEEEDHNDHEEHANDEHEEGGHDEHGHGAHEEEGFVKLSRKQQQMAGIQVVKVKSQSNIKQIILAPGEVVNDLYNTTLLTTQVDSKVLKRKVVLGQHVHKGDVIAILYSLDIATVQNQLKVALSEWQRVRKLGKQTVGAKRFVTAKADYDKNKSLLEAYGFNRRLIELFIQGKNTYKLGEYPIIAPHNGVILEDNFQSGQFLPIGSTIAMLVDEENVWVEALLAPEIGQRIPVGTKANITIDKKIFSAEVIHDSHAIDEITRTRKIRLIIKNNNHLLHAGLFAKVAFKLAVKDKIILLPESALMRSSDGDWTVFVEQKEGVFKQEEVELKNTINGMHQIKGLHSGERVAIKGAFFLASEIAKGGFDPHNH